MGLNRSKHYLFVKIAATLREAILAQKISAGEVSDTGKYSAGTGCIHHTGTGGFSDPRKGRASGTEAEQKSSSCGRNRKNNPGTFSDPGGIGERSLRSLAQEIKSSSRELTRFSKFPEN